MELNKLADKLAKECRTGEFDVTYTNDGVNEKGWSILWPVSARSLKVHNTLEEAIKEALFEEEVE